MKKTYRPLPECLTIKESEIEGLGLFSTDEIKKDVCLGVTHVSDVRFDDSLIRTPLGGYINHSDSPNCILKKENKTTYGFPLRNYLHTLRDINPGEEITVTYTTYKV